MRRGFGPTTPNPSKFVGWPTLKLIWKTTWDMLCASWVEKLLAPMVCLMLVCIGLVFLPYILIYDLAVLIERASQPEAEVPAEIKLERTPGIFVGVEAAGLRCAYCHDQVGGLTHTCGECGTLIHPACGIELGGCPTLGCSKGPTGRQAQRV